jgi:hypothetical protein
MHVEPFSDDGNNDVSPLLVAPIDFLAEASVVAFSLQESGSNECALVLPGRDLGGGDEVSHRRPVFFFDFRSRYEVSLQKAKGSCRIERPTESGKVCAVRFLWLGDPLMC